MMTQSSSCLLNLTVEGPLIKQLKEEIATGCDSVPAESEVSLPKEKDVITSTVFGLDDAAESSVSTPEQHDISDARGMQVTTSKMDEHEEKLTGTGMDENDSHKKEIAPIIADSMFKRLDDLLNRTQLYSEYLLEKMDYIALSAPDIRAEISEEETSGGVGTKRKASTSLISGREKFKAADHSRLSSFEHTSKALEENSLLTEEERYWKEQMEIAPLLTGGRLKSYQLKGIKWLISLSENGLNGILADQMGLGKTVQTIGFLAHLKGIGVHGPFLVCAPLSTLSNWVNEVRRWVPTMEVLLYHGSREERSCLRRIYIPSTVDASFPVIVTSFEVATNDRKILARYKWKLIVVDEGHRLKNFDCKLLRELRQIPTHSTLLLTGTPLQNNLSELWSLLNFILPQIFTSRSEFQSWFDLSGSSSDGSQVQNDGRDQWRLQVISKLHLILRPFLLRRLKEDVEISLPSKKEIILYAPMSEKQKQYNEFLLNKTLEKHLEDNLWSTGVPAKINLCNVFMQLRKIFNHPDLLTSQFEGQIDFPPVEVLVEQCGKLKLLDRLLVHLKAGGHKVLIFSQMTQVLDILEYYLNERGFQPFRIDGSVAQAHRQEQIRDFNQAEGANIIFLLSTRAGGLGINLTSADTAIIYDSDWNPHMDMQAMDRCHRIGQTRPVHVYRLVTSHSVECRMLKVAAEKLKLEHIVIEKGQFRQEEAHVKIVLEEADLLALVRQERNEEEDLVQSAEVSDENLLKLLDRSDMLKDSEQNRSDRSLLLPLKGPGWEVVNRSAKSSVLSSVEGGCSHHAQWRYYISRGKAFIKTCINQIWKRIFEDIRE
ncbi:hypothetical protein KP509_15G047300 [Ceratopteris richardii]|uniref:Uncharacterized protein n=1 Tax=Ceratopteris richardii TaxID=49495 RepID=A0A8T2T7T2_CERRI|nr:hypothetical protein KP509_15G047300 [Ceratopteris richardii]